MYGVEIEAGNVTISDVYVNNSYPFYVLGEADTFVNIKNIRNTFPKGIVSLGASLPISGIFEDIYIDGNEITIINAVSPFTLKNPVVINSPTACIKANAASGNEIRIINPICDNATTHGIQIEGMSGEIHGGTLKNITLNGITLNPGYNVRIHNVNISNVSRLNPNQYSNIIIGGAASRNNSIHDNQLWTYPNAKYAIESTSGNNSLIYNNWLSATGQTGSILLQTNDRARDNYNAPGYDHGNSATAPTAFGFGDKYSNSTSLDFTCGYTGTQWQNSTGNTDVC